MRKGCFFNKSRLGVVALVIVLAMLLGCSMASVTITEKDPDATREQTSSTVHSEDDNAENAGADDLNTEDSDKSEEPVGAPEPEHETISIEKIETAQDYIKDTAIAQGNADEIILAEGVLGLGEYGEVRGSEKWLLGLDEEARILVLDEKEHCIAAYAKDGTRTVKLNDIPGDDTTKVNCVRWDGQDFIVWSESKKQEDAEADDVGQGWCVYLADLNAKTVTVIDQDAGIRADENYAHRYVAPTKVSVAEGYVAYISFEKDNAGCITEVVKVYDIASEELKTIYFLEDDPTCNALGDPSIGNGKIAWAQAYIRPDFLYEGYTLVYELATGKIYILDTPENVINPCINGEVLIAENNPNQTYYDSEIVLYAFHENKWIYKISAAFPDYYTRSSRGVGLGQISAWGDYVTWDGMILPSVLVFNTATNELYTITDGRSEVGAIQIYPGGLLAWYDRWVDDGKLVAEIHYCILK